MLSHEDERRLAAIERQLLIDDPTFARRLRRHTYARSAWRQALAAVTGILCTLAACLGMLANSGTLFLSSAALTVAAAWAYRRARRRHRRKT
jgi:DUF3040 family protein